MKKKIIVRCDPDTKALIKRESKKHRMTVSNFIRNLIRDHCK